MTAEGYSLFYKWKMQEEQVVDELLQNAKDINMGKN